MEGDPNRQRVLIVERGGGIGTEIHVQIFDLRRHVARNPRLDAAARGPAHLGGARNEGDRGRLWVAVAVQVEARIVR